MKLELLNNGTCPFHDKGLCFIHIGKTYMYVCAHAEQVCVCACVCHPISLNKLSLIRTQSGNRSLGKNIPSIVQSENILTQTHT